MEAAYQGRMICHPTVLALDKTRSMPFRIAAFCIGLVLALYWMQVLRHGSRCWKGQRTGGRTSVPPEPLGRALRILWIPVVAVWITYPFVIALARVRGITWQPIYSTVWIAAAAAPVGVFICFQLTRKCWRIMGKNWRMGINPNEKNTLVLDTALGGLQCALSDCMRLSQAMMICTMIAIPAPPLLIAGCLHLLLLQWEARREESHLRRVHGDAYSEYARNVGRFVPRIAERNRS